MGAGGKMGVRSAANLARTDFEVAHVEISDAGRARLKAAIGVDCVDADTALAQADVVVLAVPDTAIKAVAAAIIDKVRPGTMIVCLDAPVARSHRVTVEQMALLEPGPSETVCASLLDIMREAMDEVVARGVPKEAARDFLLGHMNILGAVIFKEIDGVFSDACNKAITFGKPMLMRDDWKRVFEPEEIAASIQRIT